MKHNFLATCILSLIAMVSLAQKGPQPGTAKVVKPRAGSTYAIIVGVSTYEDSGKIQQLHFAHKDAEYFYEFLKNVEGVPDSNIVLIKNSAVTEANVRAELYKKLNNPRLKWPIKQGDRLYFYFSGHGELHQDQLYYLLPSNTKGVEAKLQGLESPVIDLKDFKISYLQNGLKAGAEVFLIIDACRTEQSQQVKNTDKLFKDAVNENEYIMLSSSAGQPSFEHRTIGNGGQGIFTYYLLEGLYGAADNKANTGNGNGAVEYKEIERYLSNNVPTKSLELFPTKEQQHPKFYSITENTVRLSEVDSFQLQKWAIHHKMKDVKGEPMFAMGGGIQKGGLDDEPVDTLLMYLYNRFNAELNKEKLVGDGSAEVYFNLMFEKWPHHRLTEEAKITLATELVNFCQQKINLFVSGKGVLHIQRLEEDISRTLNDTVSVSIDGKSNNSSSSMQSSVMEEIKKIKRIATTQFDDAAAMIKKAMDLLADDPMLLKDIVPKYNFLKAAALSDETDYDKIQEGIRFCREAIIANPKAAYNYLIMGWLLDAIHADSSVHYYKQSIQMAPSWAIAQNSLANYYNSHDNDDLALLHYKKAVTLDSLYTNAYNSIGNIYYYTDKDSAKLYYQKALKADPKFAYASANLGLIYMNEDGDKPLSSKNFKLAEQYLKNAIVSDSTYAGAYTKLADLYEKTPDKSYRDSSVFYLKKWISINKNSTETSVMSARADIYRALADIHLTRSETAKAGLNQKLAFNADSSEAESYIHLAKFYIKIDRPENAIEIYERGMKRFPRSAAIFNSVGNFYYKSDESANAIKYYKKALAIQPGSANINYNISLVYSDRQEYDLAILYNRRAINASPEDASLFHSMGHIYENVDSKTSGDSALYYFRKAALLDPTDNEALSHIGSIYKSTGDYEQALKYFLLALKNDPNDPVKYKNVGTAYYGLNEYGDAEKHFKKSLSLDPDNASLYHDLGHVYQKQEKYGLAMTSFKTGLQYDPTDLQLYNHIAKLYSNEEQYQEANRYLELALKVDPKAASIYVAIAENFESLKDLEKAESNYLKAIEANSGYAQAYHGLGHLYFNDGKYETAIELFKKALEYEEDAETYIEILLHIGDYYLEKGADYFEEAETYYLKVLKINDEYNLVYYNLACLYAVKDNPGQAIDYLRKAFKVSSDKDRQTLVKWCKEDADLDNIRQHPKFKELVNEYDK